MRPGLVPELRPADLRVLGRSERSVIRTALARSVLAAVVSTVVLAVVSRPTTVTMWISLLVVVALFGTWNCHRTLRAVSSAAEKRRTDIDMAVAVILDLVNIQTAGGAGIETALMTAVGVGDSWAFAGIRDCLSAAHAARRSYWDALLDLGHEWGSRSLLDVANAGRLTGSHGARIRQSLVSKAASLRARNLARVEHEAQERTEQMGIPMVLLFVSFICFVGYPALAQTIGSL